MLIQQFLVEQRTPISIRLQTWTTCASFNGRPNDLADRRQTRQLVRGVPTHKLDPLYDSRKGVFSLWHQILTYRTVRTERQVSNGLHDPIAWLDGAPINTRGVFQNRYGECSNSPWIEAAIQCRGVRYRELLADHWIWKYAAVNGSYRNRFF